MPRIQPQILIWARETAGLSLEQAVDKLDINDARGVAAVDRLKALESGEQEPSRPLLLRMAKQYRRPLIAFYMSAPPPKGDRGEDFRTLPADYSVATGALLDALLRDIKARQAMVRTVLETDEEAKPLPFVGSLRMSQGIAAAVQSLKGILKFDLAAFRAEETAEDAFALLRGAAENAGVFVLLAGNLGNHHTTISLEEFRGFSVADSIAPFIVINDQDAKPAWSFTLLHELTHILLGTTGISGTSTDSEIERFCNDAAGEFLLPTAEVSAFHISKDFNDALNDISAFAKERNVSRSMVAYKLLRSDRITNELWRSISAAFRDQWLRDRAANRDRNKQKEGGPSYYVVRRHRLGIALLELVQRSLGEGNLTPTKAGKVLGVKPRNVEPLLRGLSPLSSTRMA